VSSRAPSPDKVDLAEKLATFGDHWNPRIVAELNGQHVKVVKFAGEFTWHSHDHEDELFLVVKGLLRMELRDRVVELGPGQLIVIPRGVEHRPCADAECEVVLFEPASTVNTGTATDDPRTRTHLDRI
jgi:mannose-6-phosphate isomerase-like protein (cupin superfamily)